MKQRLLATMACLLAGAIARAAGAATCSPTTFITAATYAAPDPVQVIVADFNQDGFPDVAASSGNGASVVSVLLNNGDGTFGAPTSMPIPNPIFRIAAADLRGNGKVDIIGSTYSGIEVLLGNGDGSFAPPVFYSSNSYGGSALVVGKFDANGTPDVVLADQYGQDLEFLPGNGDGTFGAPIPTAASNVVAMVAGDFDGDSKLDLVVSNGNAGTISFYPGLGDGTFGLPTAFVAGNGPGALAAADFDGNGNLDVAVTSGTFVSVLLGNGDGTFQAALQYSAGPDPVALAAADFNQDGFPDVAVVDLQLSAAEILFGAGDGALGPATPYLLAGQASGLAIGDLDGDSLPDLVSGNQIDAIVVLRNAGSGSLLAIPESSLPSSPFQYNYQPQVTVGDWDRDGRQDLAWTSNSEIDVIRSLGAGRFAQTHALTGDPANPQLYGVASGDLDGDGKADLVSADYNDVLLFAGNGDSSFAAPRSVFNSYNLGIVSVADFTGEGRPDIAVMQNCCGSQAMVVLPGNGDGTFQPPVQTPVGFDVQLLLPADLNGDGRADLVESTSSGVYVQISNGDGTFQSPALVVSNGNCCFSFGVAVGSFSGGPLDLLLSAGGPNVALYPGNGDGTFGSPVFIGLSTSAGPVTTGDYDGDGHQDLAVISSNRGIVVFPGLGNRHFQTPVSYPAGPASLALVTGGFTGGGLPDVAAIGQGMAVTLVNSGLDAIVPSVSVLVGSPATLAAVASGFGPVSYQWRKNGTPLADGGSVSGATTATLVIDPAEFTDAGSYDVVVTDSCTTATSNAATLSVEFADVPISNIFHDDILTIATAGVTAGCGGADYCPTALVTRAQMAVFLLKSEHGSGYVPPACTGTFTDVPCPSAYADWIEQLAAEGVTAGCGGGDYCPDASVTRAQMAVFLLKTSLGAGYVPPPWTAIFGDVPSGSFAADFIDDLYNRGIAGGCSASPLLYCPNSPVNRGQMAAFLVNTFF